MTMAMPADISGFANAGMIRLPATLVVKRVATVIGLALLPWAGIAVLVRVLFL
jgi:hypothetical protein